MLRSTRNRVPFLAVTLSVLVAAGCFNSPDTSKLQCLDDAHCPSGYACVGAQAGKLGVCTKGTTGPDAVADLAAPRDGSPDLDATSRFDATADQRDGADVVLPDGGLLDTTTVSGPEVMADTPPAPGDAAADRPADLSGPDGPGDVAKSDLGADGADVAGPRPDAAADAPPDLPPDSSPDSSKKPRGAACAAGSECADGFCADGYCCDSACTGTCQACDVVPGKCSTLSANATPRSGHGSCTTSDATCAGKCDGTSSACSYPTVACGTASCTGTTFTPAGTCSAGTCAAAASRACPTNQTCSGNACACLAPKLDCSGACIDPTSDAQNCGACGHDCKGGACVQGRCQPVVIAGNLDEGGAGVFGVDGQYVYYWTSGMGPDSVKAYRVAKTAVGGTGTLLSDYGVSPQGVIGTTIIFSRDRFGFQSSCNLTDCSNTIASLPVSGATLVDFRSPAPQYFAQAAVDPALKLTWFVPTSNTVVTTYNDTGAPIYFFDEDFFGYGTMVYWIRNVQSSAGDLTDRVLYGLDSTNMARSQLAGGMSADLRLVDANATSVLLQSSSNGDLYRVALPFGSGSSAPPRLLAAASATTVIETATGIYWVDNGGTLYRCSASDCAGTKTILTNGQTAYRLYEDDTFLYWGTSSPNQVVRLVK